MLGAWSVRFVGWADWVDCRCFLSFVFLGVARYLERSSCNTDLEEPTRLEPDIRRCIPYLLYCGDVTDDTFRLLMQQMRPFGVQVIVYPHRASLQHLEERGIMGYLMGPAWTECIFRGRQGTQ